MTLARSESRFGAKPTPYLSTPLSKPELWSFRVSYNSLNKAAKMRVLHQIALEGHFPSAPTTSLIHTVIAKFYYDAAMEAAKYFCCSVQDVELVSSPFKH